MTLSLSYFNEDDKFNEQRIIEITTAYGFDVTTVREKLNTCYLLYKGKDNFTCENAYEVNSCLSKMTKN